MSHVEYYSPTSSDSTSHVVIPPKVILEDVRSVNIHDMQTIAKTAFSQPRLEPKLLLTLSEPKTVKQTLSNLHLKEAMQAEYDALMSSNTWTLVQLPLQR